jgi:hypothetical protein
VITMTPMQADALNQLLNLTDFTEIDSVVCQGWGSKMKVYVWNKQAEYDKYVIDFDGNVFREVSIL